MLGVLDPHSPFPRYYQIYSTLREGILSGEYPPGQALPAERQIAKAYGVARLTVVKAFDLLERDGLIDRQHGRGTFVIEPSKSGPFVGTIALIGFPAIDRELLIGISQTALEHQYQLQVLGIDLGFKHLDTYLTACLSGGVRGFLIYARPLSSDAAIYQRLLNQGVPIVMVDRYYPQLECDHVVYNNQEASALLTSKLIARGHQTIAVLPGYERDITSVRDRLSGYRQALEQHGLTYDEELVWLDLYDFDQPIWLLNGDYWRQLHHRLKRHRPTAVVTINDSIANRLVHDLLVIKSSHSTGPQSVAEPRLDLALATFCNHSEADRGYLNAVAVHPFRRLGQASAKLLIERISGAATGPSRQLVVPMEIVELPSGDGPLPEGGDIFQHRK